MQNTSFLPLDPGYARSLDKLLLYYMAPNQSVSLAIQEFTDTPQVIVLREFWNILDTSAINLEMSKRKI